MAQFDEDNGDEYFVEERDIASEDGVEERKEGSETCEDQRATIRGLVQEGDEANEDDSSENKIFLWGRDKMKW